MRRAHYAQRHSYDMPSTAFVSAEDAWFWFIRCQRMRWEGARLTEGCGNMSRPCEPDDLYRAVMWLYRRRLIGSQHLKVLFFFGERESPPDPRCREEERAARIWDAALDRLSTVLKSKGIVECGEMPGSVDHECSS